MNKPLESIIDVVLKETQDDISRVIDFGVQGGFVAVQDAVKNLTLPLIEIQNYDFGAVPGPLWQPINSGLSQLLQTLKSIKEYNPAYGAAMSREQLIQAGLNQCDSIQIALFPVLSFLRTSQDNGLQSVANAGVVLRQMEAMQAAAQLQQDSILKEAEEILSTAKDTAANVGVASHATHFKSEADSQQRQSIIWLAAIIISAIIIGYMALSYIPHEFEVMTKAKPAGKVDTPEILQFSVIRLFQVFPFLYALVFCAKNYAATKHNAVANRHRQHALSTFETFAKAATDDATKNQVLTQATQAIFAPQATGYIAGDSDMSGGTQVFEVIKTLVSPSPAPKA